MIQVENERRPVAAGFIDIMKNMGEWRESNGTGAPTHDKGKPSLLMSKAVLWVK